MADEEIRKDDVADDVTAAIAELNKDTPAEPVAETKVEAKTEIKTEPEKPREDGRDELGRFTAKEKADAAAKALEPAKEVVSTARPQSDKAQPAVVEQAQQPQAAATPPVSWSITAKAKWDTLPKEVQDACLKREQEVDQGFREYQGIKPYAERAKSQGQTVVQALQAYTGIEDLIRRDVGAGLMHIASNAGLTQFQAGQLFAGLAQRLGHQFAAPPDQNGQGGTAPDQNGAADPNALIKVLQPALEPFMQRINNLEGTLRQQTEAETRQRLNSSTGVIEKFRSDPANRYYDNLEQQIGDLLERGIVQRSGDMAADLKAAYDLACWQNPEIRESLINERHAKTEQDRKAKEQEAANKAKAASRSVSGSPSPGASEPAPRADRKKSYDDDLYDDVRRAAQSVSASVA